MTLVTAERHSIERPRSIVMFERTFVASTVLSFVALGIDYDANVAAMVREMPGEPFAQWIEPAVLIIAAALSAALWFGVARRASVIAKWLTTFLFALGAVTMGYAWYAPEEMGYSYLVLIIDTLGVLLNAVAVLMLFQSDARDWFAGRRVDLAETFR